MPASIEHVRTDTAGRPTLVGSLCPDCGTAMFPPAPVCPACMSEAIAPADMPRTGTLYAFTIVHTGPKKWRKPSTLGYVDLPNNVRVFTHLVGPVAIDQQVELTLAEVADDEHGPITTFAFQPEDH